MVAKHRQPARGLISPRRGTCRGGEPLAEPQPGEATIAIIWPLYKQRLLDKGSSPSTLDGYKFAYQRLLEDVRNTPLRELAADPTSCCRAAPPEFELSLAP
jgi:hypothetical protein